MFYYVYWDNMNQMATVFDGLSYHKDPQIEKAFMEYKDFGSHPQISLLKEFRTYKQILGYRYIKKGKTEEVGSLEDIVKHLSKGKDEKRVVRQAYKHLAGETATLYGGKIEEESYPINLDRIGVRLL